MNSRLLLKLSRGQQTQLGYFYSTTTASPSSETKLKYYRDLAGQNVDAKPPGWDSALPFQHIPGPKPLPILGNAWRFLVPKLGNYYGLDSTDFLKRINEEYGDIAIVTDLMGREPMVYIYNPKDFETLRQNQGAWPIRRSFESVHYYRNNNKKDFFQGVTGLLTQHGEEWFKIRSLVNPILMKPKNVEHYIGKMDDIASQLVEGIRDLATLNEKGEMPENFIHELNKFGLENIAYITLNKEFGCLKKGDAVSSETQKLVTSLTELFTLFYVLEVLPNPWKLISTPTWKRFVELMDFITEFNLRHINEAVDQIKNDNSSKSEHDTSVFEKMLKLDKRIAITMASDMMLAGVDTTAKILGAALYFIAKNPETQQKLRDEALAVLPRKDSEVTKEVLGNAPYLRAVVKETLRISPIGIGNLRETVKDIVLAGYQIPKGTQVVTSNLILCLRDENYFNGRQFLPERWLKTTTGELSHKNANSSVYAPFGMGARSCIGQRLATLEIEIALLKIARNFELSWPHPDMKFQVQFLYGFVDPLKLHVRQL